jgi:hypothetical protein
MSRIADDQRKSTQASESDVRLAERREALRRAVSDLGDVTTRFRSRLEESGHELPPRAANGSASLAELAGVANGEAPRARSPLSPAPAPPPGPAATELSEERQGEAIAYRDAALADARKRFDAASRQADELIRTITQAVQSEARAVHADVEAAAEARFREIEVEAQRRLRRAQAEADALLEQRRRRIAEVSDRILELAENLAGRLAEADQVRGQFDVFVQALSKASDRLASVGNPAAKAPAPAAPPGPSEVSESAIAELSAREDAARSGGLAEAA